MKLMLKYLKKYRFHAILGPIFKFIEAFFELIVPLVMAQIIDNGIKNNDSGYIFKMGGILLGIGALGLASSLTCQYFASYASQHSGTDLRNDFFQKVNRLPYERLNEIESSTLRTRFTTDINQVQSGIAMIIRLGIRAPLLIIGATVMAALINPLLSIIFCLVIPVVGLVIYLIMKKTTPMYKDIQKKLDKVGTITKENLSGVRVIRAFAKEEEEINRFKESQDVYTASCIRTAKIQVLLSPIVQVVVNLGIVAILYFGSFKVNSGSISQGQLTALLNYMTQVMLALFAFANLMTIFTKALASSNRVDEILSMEDRKDEGTQLISSYDLEFKDVSFAYKDGKNAINHLSFKVNQGETLGVIGGTGSGKSTLAKLLLRFIDPTEGQIILGGKDIKEYSLHDLREKMGYVPQKTRLFSGSISSNLSMGKEVTEKDLWEALAIAQMKDTVQGYKEGLDYHVEEGGTNFSGGQKQRLSIARAIAKKPKFLLLDDASSALDFATEKALRNELEKMETTKVLISQRVQTIKNASLILVLDNGNCEGLATDLELRKQSIVYQEIVNSQNRG